MVFLDDAAPSFNPGVLVERDTSQEQQTIGENLGTAQISCPRSELEILSLQDNERVLISKSSRKWLSCGVFGGFTIVIKEEKVKRCKPKATYSTGDQRVEEVRRCYIRPSFLSWCFEFQVVIATNRQTLFTAKQIHIVDQQTEFTLRQIFFDKDLISFRHMLENRTVTLDSYTADGKSLLLVSQDFPNLSEFN